MTSIDIIDPDINCAFHVHLENIYIYTISGRIRTASHRQITASQLIRVSTPQESSISAMSKLVSKRRSNANHWYTTKWKSDDTPRMRLLLR